MLHLSLCTAALIVGPAMPGTQTRMPTRVGSSPEMMPKFLKKLLPDLEKPDDGLAALTFGLFSSGAPPAPIEVKGPAVPITAAGKAMPLLSPIFNLEAIVQAIVLNLGAYDEEAVQAEIDATVSSAPVVIYTYPLSPFSTEALAVLESTGCKLKNVPLGLEWFALGPQGSATRVQLRKMTGQGSLPHVFIGGQWCGGLATGAEGGLTGLVERDELVPLLKKAKAL